MALVAFFLIFQVVLIAAHFHWRWRQRRDPQAPSPPRRLTPQGVRDLVLHQLLLATVLGVTYWLGAWNGASVGSAFVPELWQLSLVSILVGEIGFLALILVYWLLLAVAGRFERMRLTATRGNLLLWPRKTSHKMITAVFIMIFNPVTEELVMRGILIHQWGLLLGSPVIPIMVGFVLNALLHWYQGWRMQLWHAMFFALAVTLLYQWDLVAAITAHLLGDVLPFLVLRRNLQRVRAARRKARAARVLRPA